VQDLGRMNADVFRFSSVPSPVWAMAVGCEARARWQFQKSGDAVSVLRAVNRLQGSANRWTGISTTKE